MGKGVHGKINKLYFFKMFNTIKWGSYQNFQKQFPNNSNDDDNWN
jgi:hypothetical protein